MPTEHATRTVGSADADAPALLSHGFAPVARADARALILGSLPGRMSLERQQYYAQPRNAFWPIVAELCGFAADAAYRARTRAVAASGIALWDVLAAAERPGSLDSAIVTATMRINDFGSLFDRCARIEAVFFNGRKAEDLFRRHVVPRLGGAVAELAFLTLPSTSPANAGVPFAAKRAAWHDAIDPYLSGGRRPHGRIRT